MTHNIAAECGMMILDLLEHKYLQATEDFLVHLLEDCNLCAIHAKRVTISKHFAVPGL